MDERKGIWTAIKYKNEVVDPSLPETDPRKRRPTIYLWVRDTNLQRHRLRITGFRPYFYVIPAVESDAHSILEMDEIEHYETVSFGTRKLIKIYTYIPGHVTKVRRAVQQRFAQAAVREGDVLFELRYLIDKGIRGAVDFTDPTDPKPLQEDLQIPLRKIYIDIEVWSQSPSINRMKPTEYIKCITAYDSYEKVYYTWYYNEWDLGIAGDNDWKIIWCPTVEKMMEQFCEFVATRDPDVLTGYNIDFDLCNIRQECLRRGLHQHFYRLSALSDLGYVIEGEKVKKHRIRGVDWARRGLVIDGREIIDILDCVRMISKTQLKSYSLDFVVKTFLDPSEGKITYNGLPVAANITKVWKEAPEVVLEYNKHDVELIVRLDEKKDLIGFLDELRKTVGVRLEDAFSNQRMIDTEALRRRTFPLPSKFKRSKEEETYKGALVVDPIPGLHSWVVCLDYKSLYPTIIRTFNIDTDTYVPDVKLLSPGEDYYKFSNLEGTKTWIFRKNPRGLFPQMLDDFVHLREELKKKAETETDPVRKANFETKQEVVKVLSNAVYGTFGYRSRKHNLEVAEAITSFGQRMIKLAASIATKLGLQVVYGDTDSIFVATGAKSYEEAYSIGVKLQEEIMKYIPSFLHQFNVREPSLFEIKLEKVYDKFFMTKGEKGKAVKKRYCGRIVQASGETALDVKGFDIKRSDTSEFAASLQHKLLSSLFSEGDKESLKKEIVELINRIDTLPLHQIGVPMGVAKPLEEYKKNPIQKRAVENSNKYLKTNFTFGSKPMRVYIIPPSVEDLYPNQQFTEAERKVHEEELKTLDVIAIDTATTLPSWVKIDYPRMIKKTIKPKIERFLEALGISWTEIEENLRSEFRVQQKQKKKKAEKVTLDKFFGGSG